MLNSHLLLFEQQKCIQRLKLDARQKSSWLFPSSAGLSSSAGLCLIADEIEKVAIC